MMDWFYLCAGFAALLTFGGGVPHLEDKSLPYELGVCLRDFLELSLEMAALLSGYVFLAGRGYLPPAYGKEAAFLLFLLIPYGISRAQKRKGFLFFAVFGFCLWVVARMPAVSWRAYFLQANQMAASLTILRLLMAGLKRRLQFSQVPPPFAGLPIGWISAAILVWICLPFFARGLRF